MFIISGKRRIWLKFLSLIVTLVTKLANLLFKIFFEFNENCKYREFQPIIKYFDYYHKAKQQSLGKSEI